LYSVNDLGETVRRCFSSWLWLLLLSSGFLHLFEQIGPDLEVRPSFHGTYLGLFWLCDFIFIVHHSWKFDLSLSLSLSLSRPLSPLLRALLSCVTVWLNFHRRFWYVEIVRGAILLLGLASFD
jgi:hypothetical protein